MSEVKQQTDTLTILLLCEGGIAHSTLIFLILILKIRSTSDDLISSCIRPKKEHLNRFNLIIFKFLNTGNYALTIITEAVNTEYHCYFICKGLS